MKRNKILAACPALPWNKEAQTDREWKPRPPGPQWASGRVDSSPGQPGPPGSAVSPGGREGTGVEAARFARYLQKRSRHASNFTRCPLPPSEGRAVGLRLDGQDWSPRPYARLVCRTKPGPGVPGSRTAIRQNVRNTFLSAIA